MVVHEVEIKLLLSLASQLREECLIARIVALQSELKVQLLILNDDLTFYHIRFQSIRLEDQSAHAQIETECKH